MSPKTTSFIKSHIISLLIGALPALIGAGYVTLYRVDKIEAAQLEDKQLTEVSVREILKRIEDLQVALGRAQLDLALVCSEVVRARGGNPLAECKTMGGK
jgi:hypothetical protein